MLRRQRFVVMNRTADTGFMAFFQTSYQSANVTCSSLDILQPPESEGNTAVMSAEDIPASFFKDSHFDYLLEQSGIELESVLESSSVFESLGSSLFSADFYDPFSMPGMLTDADDKVAFDLGITAAAASFTSSSSAVVARGIGACDSRMSAEQTKYPINMYQFPAPVPDSFSLSGVVVVGGQASTGASAHATHDKPFGLMSSAAQHGYMKAEQYRMADDCKHAMAFGQNSGRKAASILSDYQTLQRSHSQPASTSPLISHTFTDQALIGGYHGGSPSGLRDRGMAPQMPAMSSHQQIGYVAHQLYQNTGSDVFEMAPLSPPGSHFRFPAQGPIHRQSMTLVSEGMPSTVATETGQDIIW